MQHLAYAFTNKRHSRSGLFTGIRVKLTTSRSTLNSSLSALLSLTFLLSEFDALVTSADIVKGQLVVEVRKMRNRDNREGT